MSHKQLAALKGQGKGVALPLQGGWFILVTFTQGGGICVKKHSRLALG